MNERNDVPSEENPEGNTALSQFFSTAKEALARYTHCSVCGAHLHFTHVTDFSKNLTQETARCPECGVRARRHTHRLQ
jgi:DNA-directed RNA polymerase subunit RPC12/RpoP